MSEQLRYHPGFRNLALLDLFGFVTIETGIVQPRQGWQVERICPTQFGDAMLTLVSQWFNEENFRKLELPFEQTVGEFQPLLQPYFPSLEQTIQLPGQEFREGMYTFKVALDTDIWRRIAIPPQDSLDVLSHAILRAFDFDSDHLYQYIIPTRYGTTLEVVHSYMDGWDQTLFTSEVRIGELPLSLHDTMLFNFDFGDNWYFSVTLEEIDTSVSSSELIRSKPHVMEVKGDAPPQYPDWDDDEWVIWDDE